MNTPRFHIAPRLWVLLFFAGYLALGLLIYDDYGLSWDEPSARFRGFVNYQYIFEGRRELFQLDDESRYHGPVFEIFLSMLEEILHLTDLREIYFMRHAATFGLFYGSVYGFYWLCKHRFRSWKIGLIGSFCFIASPRIFADSFYNPKDIPFLAVFIISMCTLVRYLEKKTILRTLTHALACAILVDLRILGVLVPGLTFLGVVGGLLAEKGRTRALLKQETLFLMIYAIFGVNFAILFFPMLWEDPWGRFLYSFTSMQKFNWVGTVLYAGKILRGTQLPWHYLPVWIGITTPIVYSLSFLIGLGWLVSRMIRHPRQVLQRRERQFDLLVILWCGLPIMMVIALNSVVYDSWRHVFFVYPAFLLIALHGTMTVNRLITGTTQGRVRVACQVIARLGFVICILPTMYFMARYHPYQNLYFNILAGRDMQTIKRNFELDYWGLSYRQGLEYIAQTDSRNVIKLTDPNLWADHRLHILPEADRKRMLLVNDAQDADYFISNYRWHPADYPYQHEVFSVKIRGVNILVVYKLTTGGVAE